MPEKISTKLLNWTNRVRSLLYIDEERGPCEEVAQWSRRLWKAHPWAHRVLHSSDDIDYVRKTFHNAMVERERAIRETKIEVHPLEWLVIRDASRAIRNILSRRCEEMAGFSALECLWTLAHGRPKEEHHDLKAGFFEEFHRLFLAVQGRSGLYEKTSPAFTRLSGREAAAARSSELDSLALEAEKLIARYPTGIASEVVRLRQANRRRICKEMNSTSEKWKDWRWQVSHVVRDEETLGRLVKLTTEERRAIRMARENRIPFGVTPYTCSLMDEKPGRERDHAIRAQVIPSVRYVEEMIKHRTDGMHSADFMMESDTSPADTIVRRYPRIAIFKPFNTCAQICVYCQRNWEISDVLCPNALASKETREKAFRWFECHPRVREVLITGGDPLLMSDSLISGILERFSGMKHIERIRIGSRTPVVLPSRITSKLADILGNYHRPPERELVFVTHFEHTYEVTPEAMAAVQRLRRRNISVYNQMVLTMENSRRFESVATRLALRQIGVEPYYTFMMKGKGETDEMRVPVARALQEQKEEDRLMPGMARTDETVYNVPRLGKNYIRAAQHHDLIMIMPDGSRMLEFHPWEKNIALADTYVGRDVPIHDYLMELARRGENVADYESIWYYY